MIYRIKQRFLDWWRGNAPLFGGVARSSRWPSVRKDFLILHDKCEVCGSKKSVEPHHIFPFHLDIEKKYELDYNNLISLCRKNQCHLLFGHFRSFAKSYNPNVREDAKIWKEKILKRPQNIKEEDHSP